MWAKAGKGPVGRRRFLSSIRQKNDLLVHIALFTITLAGAGLRFLRIGRQPLWLDEAFSVWMSRQSIPEIIRLTIDIDQHPPFYHIMLHLWNALGGYSEAWARSLSAILSILTIIVIYYLGKTLAGPLVGILAALVLALSPFHIQYAQEARTYALLALCASLSMLFTTRLLFDARARTQPVGLPLRWGSFNWNWLGYMLFTALTMFGHNTAIFLPIATNLFVFGLMIFRRFVPASEGQMQAPSLRNWLVAQIGVFLIWCLWLPSFYFQAKGVSQDFWIQAPTVESVFTAIKAFLMANLPEQISWKWLIWTGYTGLFLLAFLKVRRQAGHFLFLAVLFLTPLLGELLVSLYRPIFYDRTLIWGTIPLYILMAAGISRLRYRPYILTAVFIIATLSLLSVDNYFRNVEKERWDQAAAYMAKETQSGDIIIFNSGWTQIPFDYYFAQYDRKLEEFGAPQTMFEHGELQPRMTEQDLPRLRDIIRGRSRVWLVYSHNWFTDPDSLIQNALSTQMRLVEMKNFNGLQIQFYTER